MKENDCISRKRAIERLKLNLPISQGADNSRDRHRYMQALADIQAIRELPSVTPQEPQTFKWCDTCKEYDQVNHCCHRWSKVIKNTVEDMKREPIIDKIRAEIVELTKCPYGTECLGANCPSNTDCMICGEHVLEIIDNYKADKEG